MASSPSTLFRLPDEASARKILTDATGKGSGSQTPEGKARRNLYKGIDWTYKGLAADQKLTANQSYKTATNKADADLNADFGAAKDDIDIERVIKAIKAINSINQATEHSGHVRHATLTPTQLTAVDQALLHLDEYLKAMKKGDHDAIIDAIFPAAKGTGEKAAAIRLRVIETFERALSSVHALRATKHHKFFSKPVNLLVDSYAPAISVGGLAGVGIINLAPGFFTSNAGNQEAILLHESTHTIRDETYRTYDNGGYIGFAKFEEATLAERYKNASHFEAIVRRINNEVLPSASISGAAPDPAAQAAQETMQAAWIQGLVFYSTMQRLGTAPVKDKGSLEALYTISRLFGLTGYQGVNRKSLPPRSISVTDLAAVENRVGKLASMLASANLKIAVKALTDAGTALTKNAILLKLIEREGSIRTKGNLQKTADMIEALAGIKASGQTAAEEFFTKYPL